MGCVLYSSVLPVSIASMSFSTAHISRRAIGSPSVSIKSRCADRLVLSATPRTAANLPTISRRKWVVCKASFFERARFANRRLFSSPVKPCFSRFRFLSACFFCRSEKSRCCSVRDSISDRVSAKPFSVVVRESKSDFTLWIPWKKSAGRSTRTLRSMESTSLLPNSSNSRTSVESPRRSPCIVGVPGESVSEPTISCPIPSIKARMPASPWKCPSTATKRTE